MKKFINFQHNLKKAQKKKVFKHEIYSKKFKNN